MNKGILSVFGVLSVLAILISGCSKPDEKKTEAPPVEKQTLEEKAPAVEQESATAMKEEEVEKAEGAEEATEEKAPTTTDQPVGTAKEIDTSVDIALEEFKKDIKGGEEFLKSAKGVLVIPKVFKAGFVVGGAYGEGALRIGGKTVDYYSTAAASFGFLAGAQSMRVILVFMQDEALKKFRESKGWEAGVDGSVVLVELGAAGTIDTTTIKDPIVGFVFGNKGLMADLSLAGSKYTKIVR